jgi:ABC-type dipeptide/oligopeptide/nickel transport system ATPase subunit
MSEAIVDVQGLTVEFPGRPPVRAVGGVDLTLKPGEVLALLGESGSGKSVTLRALMRLLPKRAAIGGTVRVDGRDVRAMRAPELSSYRGSIIAMIFQEPGLAFDPVYSVGDQIAEAVVRHAGVSRAEGRARALELFERVRIPSAARRLDNYPHEMSGGMRQRAMIALALSCRPKVLLADEPTTALDATVQIQILLLLRGGDRDRRPHRRDVCGPHRRDRLLWRGDTRKRASLYAGSAVVAGRPGLRTRRSPDGDPRCATGPFAAHGRLRVCAALRQGPRCVPQRIAGGNPGRPGACGALRPARKGAARDHAGRVSLPERPLYGREPEQIGPTHE